jgi:hypothetical protein
MSNSRIPILNTLACLVFVAVAPGCRVQEAAIGEVAGVVRIKGKPLSNVVVLFENSKSGVSLTATTDGDGRFKLSSHKAKGLPLGHYRVAIQPGALAQESMGQRMTFDGPAKQGQSPIARPDRSPATTRLKAEVRPGLNEFAFDLQR